MESAKHIENIAEEKTNERVFWGDEEIDVSKFGSYHFVNGFAENVGLCVMKSSGGIVWKKKMNELCGKSAILKSAGVLWVAKETEWSS